MAHVGDRRRNPRGLDPRPNREWRDAPGTDREHLATMRYPPSIDRLPRPAHISTHACLGLPPRVPNMGAFSASTSLHRERFDRICLSSHTD